MSNPWMTDYFDEADWQLGESIVENPDNCIHRIPAELWRQIFSHLASDSIISRGAPFRYCRLGWLTVTHVCSKWRRIALDFPRLWALSICGLPNATSTLIERARSMPLVFDSTHGSSEHSLYTKQLELARKHIYRIEALSHDDRYNWWPIFDQQCFPILKALRISPDFFPMSKFKPSAPSFPSLASLTLVSGRNTLAQLIRVLQNTPALENLFLHEGISQRDDDHFIDVSMSEDPGSFVVDLPQLSTIEVYDSVAKASLILRHMKFPAKTSVCLILKTWYDSDGGLLWAWLFSRTGYDTLTAMPFDSSRGWNSLPGSSGFVRRPGPTKLITPSWDISLSSSGDQSTPAPGMFTVLANRHLAGKVIHAMGHMQIKTFKRFDFARIWPDFLLSGCDTVFRRRVTGAYEYRHIYGDEVFEGFNTMDREDTFSLLHTLMVDMTLVLDKTPSVQMVRMQWRNLTSALKYRSRAGHPVKQLRLFGRRYALKGEAKEAERRWLKYARKLALEVIDERVRS